MEQQTFEPQQPIVNTQSAIPQQPSPQVNMQNRNSGTPVAAILTVIIMLLLGTTIFFGYQYFQTNKRIAKTALVQNTNTVKTEPLNYQSNPQKTIPEDWKTYSNKVSGYSIQYPPSFKTQVAAAGASIKEATPEARNMYIYEQGASQPYIERYVSIENFQAKPSYPTGNKTLSSIAGVEVTKISIPTSQFDIYLMPTTSNEYLEIYITKDTQKQLMANQILSTLKFTDLTKSINPEEEIRTFIKRYMNAIMNEDLETFKSLLTIGVQSEFNTNSVASGIKSYEILSISKPDKDGNYYISLKMISSKTNNPMLVHGNNPTIMVRQENGEWKSLTMQLFE